MFSASKTGATGGYQIPNSLRFRSSASAYLSRTPSVAGNRTTWTWSGWVKAYGNQNGTLFAARTAVGANYTILSFSNANGGVIRFVDSTTTYPTVEWTRIFRDPSAWYHIVFVCDTTQATAANRAKLYVNGEAVTTTTSLNAVTQNANLTVNSTDTHLIGQQATGSYLDGYFADINFIDGQALTPSSFGSINATTGVWQPARYTGSYGTNGFYLKFNNGTSTTTLGYDTSGNGNNWTTNNISLTAGSTYDWMIDSPTSYAGSSYGVGNYAVLSPLITGNVIAPSSGNLDSSLSSGGNAYFCTVGTMAVASGKWYWECSITARDSGAGQWVQFGIVSRTTTYTNNALGYSGNMSNGYAYYNDGNKAGQGSAGAYAAAFTTSDVIGVALDLGAGTLTFYKNGTSQGQAFSGITSAESWLPIIQIYRSTGTTNSTWINFGQRPFAYTPPSGFKSLCTQNLSAPAIANGAKYMAATTYTGTGSSLSISNSVNSASFQPDFVWIKNRGNTTSHVLQDSIRGAGKSLFSNATAAESGNAGDLISSFDASGFTVNNTYLGGSGGGGTDGSGYTYVGWQWKAGGTAVSNASGTITSSVSANTTAGFSVVTCAASASQTVGHGLGIAPSMIIVKSRTSASIDWYVYHASTGNTGFLNLNTTGSFTTTSTVWNNTSPTSTVFTLGSGFVAGSWGNIVAYCFAAIAGYSAFGSYTGNGSTDGPFIYCGFRPRFVMVKRTDAADSWGMFDSSRDAYNAENALLRAESSNAEASMTALVGNPFGDFLSNGFKVRNTSTLDNTSGGTYIYAAFAENPFQNSLAR